MKLVILLGFSLFISISSVYSATLTCLDSGIYCEISNLTPVTSPNEEIIVLGQPSNYTNSMTSYLYFTPPMIVNFVPTKIFKIFTNLQGISFNNVDLTNLLTNAFINCGELYSIDFMENNFPSVPASFASTCANLTYLVMIRSNIKELDIDAFKGLSQLTWIYLFQNNITCIPPGLFKNTPLLALIDISSNKISEIDSNAFNDLFYLNSLRLAGNNIINLSLNLHLTGSPDYFMAMFEDNPFNSIEPTLLSKFFTSSRESVSIMLGSYENINSCVPEDLAYIGSDDWQTANNSLVICYANWKSIYATTPVSCAVKKRSRVPRRCF